MQQSRLAILEMGFGTGLNALLTFQEGQKKQLVIDYSAVEGYPITLDQAGQLNFVGILQDPGLENPFLEMHRCNWSEAVQLSENFRLIKWNTLFEDFEPPGKFDIVYFDAFAPNAQPELWEMPLLEKMYEALHPGGVLTTYCAKGSVKRNLKALGFTVESLEGPPGKREMTRAVKP